uniref:Xylulose kinase n=1 Tax=Romanomermis culicivorax TaxID=13658 RepID=A0A915HZA4_ROMCU
MLLDFNMIAVNVDVMKGWIEAAASIVQTVNDLWMHLCECLWRKQHKLKATVLDDKNNLVAIYNVMYDDLSKFETNDGIHKHADGVTVTSPTLMFVAATDTLLDKMKQDNFDFSKVLALSGCAQQHGSVYWKNGSNDVLQHLKSDQSLYDGLKDCFSVKNSPIWMDSSTTEQCDILEKAVGGPLKLSNLTGSRAHHRFTGCQIAKIYQYNKVSYENTERISLISNFACSLFVGRYAPIDYSDGSGMNLFDLRKKSLIETLLNACAPDLKDKIGALTPSATNIVGNISPYFVERYGFRQMCQIITFTGDNPSSMIGIGLKKKDIAISLGTSDTIFAWLKQWQESLIGHVFCSPLDDDAFMGLLFKNGALTRERISSSCGCKSWNDFEHLLNKTNPGNDGNIGFYFDHPEILPYIPCASDFRFDKFDERVENFSPEVEARALVEHQALSKKTHLKSRFPDLWIDGKICRIILTGGASHNLSIAQIIADVFDTDVFMTNCVNSAAYGSALKAKF